MKFNIKTTLALFAVCGLLFMQAPHANAFELGGSKVKNFAVLNIVKILAEADASKSLKAQLNAEKAALKAKTDKKEAALTAEKAELDAKLAKLSGAEDKALQDKFIAKLNKMQNEVNKEKAALDKRSSDAFIKIRDVVLKVSKDIMDKNGYDAVFAQQNVVLVKGEVNITDEVLKRVNEDISEVKL